jgi:hypothetical protein
MCRIYLSYQQAKEIILHCKKLKLLEMTVMCTLEVDYDLDFDKLQLLETMFLRVFIEDSGGTLTIKGSPALIKLRMLILRYNVPLFDTGLAKHVEPIILDLEKCSNLKS